MAENLTGKDGTSLINFACSINDYLADLKRKTGIRIIGTTSSWIPVEIVDAFGAVLYRIPPFGERFSHSGAYIQSYTCSYARSLLERALSGKLDFLDAIIFPSLCDTIRGVSDIWREVIRGIPAVNFHIPIDLTVGTSREFLMNEIDVFIKKLSGILGIRINLDDIESAISLWDKRRQVVYSIYEATGISNGFYSNAEKYALLKIANLLDVDELEKVSHYFLTNNRKSAGYDATCVFLIGSNFSFPSFFTMLDEVSIKVVDDYICSGRAFWNYHEGKDSEKGKSPLEKIADSLLLKAGGSARIDSHNGRSLLIERIKNSGVPNVLWVTQKFCELWLWQFSIDVKYLEKEGLKVFRLEVTGSDGEEAALKTRLEAFSQMVNMGGEYY